jgi:uncharacterized membrane protein
MNSLDEAGRGQLERTKGIMRNRTVLATLMGLALMAMMGVAQAADYQFTGIVTEIDIAKKTMKVTKTDAAGKEDPWEFSTVGVKDLTKVKKGDKIIVHYNMVIKRLEQPK